MDSIRRFFKERGFLEVEVPLLASAPIPEANIKLFQVQAGKATFRLLPSPELYLKQLVAKGMERVFSISPAFRAGEEGRLHVSQFTMLEWYGAGRDYGWLMETVEELLPWVAECAGNAAGIDLSPPYPRLELRGLFIERAGWDPWTDEDHGRFDMDMVDVIEPSLPRDRPVFLVDFPPWQGSLARAKPRPAEGVERVELYLAGVELANGFSELTDREEQERRFARELAAAGLQDQGLPGPFLQSLERLPECAGMALGVDRLVMLLGGFGSVQETRSFPLFQ